MDVGNRVCGTRILNDQVVDFQVFALVETNSEVRLGQSADVVADITVFSRHVDNHVARRQLADVFVLLRLQNVHETEVLRCNLIKHIALQNVVGHLVAQNQEPAAIGAEKAFYATLDILDNALVAFVEYNQCRINSLNIRKF